MLEDTQAEVFLLLGILKASVGKALRGGVGMCGTAAEPVRVWG